MESKARTTITFHSGVLTIGGTIIEIRYQNDRIFFDFGAEYRPELELSVENYQTYLQNKLIPKLENIYDRNIPEVVWNDQEYNTAVFLSHAHLDHSKIINYLDESIPLYTMTETQYILKSLQRKGDFVLPAYGKDDSYVRKMEGLSAGDVVKVGKIEVEAVPVDHDAYGAMALLIHTPDQFIVYTGDLRRHGFESELTEQFCKKAANADVLIIEGVSVSFENETKEGSLASEEELLDKIMEVLVENPDRQITFNGYPANILRFAKLAKLTKRKTVFTAEMASLLKDILGLEVSYYYLPTEEQRYNLAPELEIDYKNVIADEGSYFTQVNDNFEDFKGGGIYIHSDAQPLGDFDPKYQVFLDKLKTLKIEFKRLAVSGHATPGDLAYIIDKIKPKLLIPIHSYKPEKLTNQDRKRYLPKRGETIIL